MRPRPRGRGPQRAAPPSPGPGRCGLTTSASRGPGSSQRTRAAGLALAGLGQRRVGRPGCALDPERAGRGGSAAGPCGRRRPAPACRLRDRNEVRQPVDTRAMPEPPSTPSSCWASAAPRARRRDAVPGERDPWTGRAARAAGGGGRAVPPVRRAQPDQRPEPRPARGARCRARAARPRPAAVLGQPELGALRRGRAAQDHRRRAPPGAGRVGVGVLVVLGVPAVPRGHRTGRQAAVRDAGGEPPVVEKVRPYWNHPGFVLAMVGGVHAALEALAPADRNRARLVFTAHSMPRSMADTSDYEAQLLDEATMMAERAVARTSTARTGRRPRDRGWDLVYQSRSGPPQVPVAGARHRRPPRATCTGAATTWCWWSPSGSPRTTWRSSTTSTPRPPTPPPGSG